MEKENQFLRLEVERTKYSKDKEGYSKFIGGLMKNRGASTEGTGNTSLTRSIRREQLAEPLQEISIHKINRQPSIQLSDSQEQLLLKSALRKAGIENSNLQSLHETRKSVDFSDLSRDSRKAATNNQNTLEQE